jgi:flavin-dependent dehydrogenase
VEGFGLPLGGIRRPLSGNRFLLCGDAASIIDPLNGEGIGNAMLIGYKAAQVIRNAFSKNDISAAFHSAYDDEINSTLLPELRQKLFLQKLFNRPWLINSLVGISEAVPPVKNWLGRRL